jgi:hypothetical protein
MNNGFFGYPQGLQEYNANLVHGVSVLQGTGMVDEFVVPDGVTYLFVNGDRRRGRWRGGSSSVTTSGGAGGNGFIDVYWLSVVPGQRFTRTVGAGGGGGAPTPTAPPVARLRSARP